MQRCADSKSVLTSRYGLALNRAQLEHDRLEVVGHRTENRWIKKGVTCSPV